MSSISNALDSEDLLKGDEKIVAEAQRRFKQCKDYEGPSRALFIEDIKFANGDSDNMYQWPDSIRQNREVDARPCVTINKTRQHNLQIINDAKQNKASIKIRPVGDNATFEAAEIFEGVIRHIEYISNADDAYACAVKFQVEGGIGYVRIVTDYAGADSFDQEIFIRRIKDPATVYLDPDINEKDGSDAKFGFIFEDMPLDQFKIAYPEYKDIAGQSALDNDEGWMGKDHVRIAEYFRKTTKKDKLLSFTDPNTGEAITNRVSKIPKELVDAVIDDPLTKSRTIEDDVVEHYLIIGEEIAEKHDWLGKYIPIARMIGEETIIDGVLDRKGHTRYLKDQQRTYNYWSSCGIEAVALQGKSPYIGAVAAIEGLETYWADANRTNYSLLPYNHMDDKGQEIPAPKRSDPPIMPQAYIEGMKIAREEFMMASGQYEETFGEKSQAISGKAINERQRQGDTATYGFPDNQATCIQFVGKICLDLIPKIYDTQRVIRILAEDGTESFVNLDPQAQQAHQEMEQQEEDKVNVIFNPNVGKYEVISDVGPSYPTKRMEAFNALSQIMQQNPQSAMLVGDLWAENSDFPDADKIAERFRNMLPPQAKGDNPEMQAMQQQFQEQMQGTQEQLQSLQKANATLIQMLAEAKIKAQNQDEKNQTDKYRAETDRMAVEGDIIAKHVVTPRLEAELMAGMAKQEHGHNHAVSQADASHARQIEMMENQPIQESAP